MYPSKFNYKLQKTNKSPNQQIKVRHNRQISGSGELHNTFRIIF